MLRGLLALLAVVPVLLALSCGDNENNERATPAATPLVAPMSTVTSAIAVASATMIPSTPNQVSAVATDPTRHAGNPAATASPVTTAASAAATVSPTAFPGEGRLVGDDGQTQVRLRAGRGGAFAITVPAGVRLWVSEPYCLPRLTCISVGEPVGLVLTTLLDLQSGSFLVLALERVYPESGGMGAIEDVGEEVLRVVVPPEGSAAVHAVFDEIVASLTRVEEASWAGSW